MKRKLTVSLTALYLLPWGMQCLINEFMSVYVSSLDFATPKTVGEVIGLGAIITAISQLIWGYFASKAKRKNLVLSLSLILVTAFSLLFLIPDITKLKLMLFVILFYSCYMAHQPLIDTIASESYMQSSHSFGFFRSFASLGYAIMGLLLVILPTDNPALIFLYTGILAALTLIFSLTLGKDSAESLSKESETEKSTQKVKLRSLFTPAYLIFLIFTVVLFASSSAISSFFAVYFTGKDHLNGSLNLFSSFVGIAAIAEWLLVMLFSKITKKLSANYIFALTAAFGVLRALTIYLAKTPEFAAVSFVFSALYFGILWASAAPYVKKLAFNGANAFAQGVWTVAAFGIGAFTGSFLGGIIAEDLGMRQLFLVVSCVLTLLAISALFLIKEPKEKNA